MAHFPYVMTVAHLLDVMPAAHLLYLCNVGDTYLLLCGIPNVPQLGQYEVSMILSILALRKYRRSCNIALQMLQLLLYFLSAKIESVNYITFILAQLWDIGYAT